MEKLLRDIESDVASITLSRSSQSESTLRGLGTVSGKAIMAVGKFALQSIERVTIQNRLRKISEQLQTEEGYLTPDMYEDVLELQRIGLYSKRIRLQAWDLILTLMERRRTERMVDVILKWPSVEVQLLLRQLSVFKLSGWTLHPARFTYVQVPPESSHRLRSTTRDDDLAYSYRSVFGAILKRDSRLLHDLFSVEEFVLIQTNTAIHADTPEDGWGPADAAGSLDHFFDYLASEHNSPLRTKSWELPPPASDFINFLSSGGPQQVRVVVVYIMDALRPFTTTAPFPLATLSLLARHSKLSSANLVHPVLSILWFCLHLLLQSQFAVVLFEAADFLDVLQEMFLCDFPGSHRDAVRTVDIARKDMRLLTCMILGVLSAKAGYPSLARRLRDDRTRFFMSIFLPFVGQYHEVNAFRLPHCVTDPPDDKREFYHMLLEYLSAADEEQDAWDVLLADLQLGLQRVVVQLVRYRLCGRGFLESGAVTILDPLDVPKFSQPTDYNKRLTTLRAVIQRVYHRDSQLLHLWIDCRSLAILQTDFVKNDIVEADGLRIFFDGLAAQDFDVYYASKLPKLESTYVDYLSTAPLAQVEVVVRYVMKAFSTFLNLDSAVESVEDVLDAHPNLRRKDLLHPILPFLQFTAHLAYASSTASQLFLDSGLPEALLCNTLTANPRRNERDLATLHTRYLLVLGALAIHHPSTIREHIQKFCTSFDLFMRQTIPTALATQLCLFQPSTYPCIDLSHQIIALIPPASGASIPTLHPIPTSPGDTPWSTIISVFEPSYSAHLPADQVNSTRDKHWAAKQVLLFAACAPETHWKPLTQILSHVPAGMTLMYSYIMSTYLHHFDARPGPFRYKAFATRPEDDVNSFLRDLLDVSRQAGFTVVHPVDRFIMLSMAATHGIRKAVEALGMDAMLKLVALVTSGWYDMGTELTSEQKSQRNKCCGRMTVQIQSITDNVYED
ncbi:hypothetical protein EIP91_006044 [Steccherinum ochraceum]|uniref:Uncharacterized protein n=1 Tax=Steccherinum ochraceum TaxID=92696 RepID=A0A4V2MVL6_9APHY|nr:hypothetical protein EIP91_006044 [Steccherinum ochraceum]